MLGSVIARHEKQWISSHLSYPVPIITLRDSFNLSLT